MAGKAMFYINSKGGMTPCIDLVTPAFRLQDIGFKKTWEQVQSFVDNAPPLAERCANCDALEYCPRCPAISQLEDGTLNGPVPYLCEIARERKVYYESRT